MYRLAIALCVCAISACAAAPDTAMEKLEDAEPTRFTAHTLVYECAQGEFVARTGPGELALWVEDRYTVLSQVPSASGSKYTEGDILFWSKGDEALLEFDGRRFTDCRLNHLRAPWEDARRRGVDFRATGNEPGWHLEVREGQSLLFIGDYGASRHLFESVSVARESGSVTYTASAGEEDVVVTARDAVCYDTMRGDRMPITVQVQLNGRYYQGCGSFLDHPWE